MAKIDFKGGEKKWQKRWGERPELYRGVDFDKREKKYVLVEFPYPSGEGLHIGHAFTFTGGDIYARYWRMKGKNVLFPMGWDAFGLPTENYAIKTKRQPQEVTRENTNRFREQMKELAFSFDWEREVNSSDPSYYKWTQWIFVKLFEKGLAYKREMPINWCPSCKIGLANEEVVNGGCERCGAEVSRRNISQWVVKITEYADRLIEGLGRTDFIEKVKTAQINWIGKSEGARIRFKVEEREEELEVFTTRADTLWGATFMVISPEHPFVERVKSKEVVDYVKASVKKSDLERTELQKEKTGVFSGVYVKNPVNGEKIPLWVADYVLMGYGTGVVMGVPAHDQRDWEFARKYDLKVVPVIEGRDKWDYEKGAMTMVGEGKMINSGLLDGLSVKKAIEKMNAWVEEEGWGRKANEYHLRDWIFSRQHYWGEPIPMVNCKKCGWVPVAEEDLPIELPVVEAYEPTDTGESPLAKIEDWVKTECPRCGGPARRETDTMPNWAGSDWYFVRFLDPKNKESLADLKKQKYWMPVDVYVGGDEHNTLHLLYSRFIYKFLFDLGVVPFDEPYIRRISHGVILGPDGQRMSKSRGNVVVPDEMVEKYGADVVRCYLMFMGPFDGTMAWNEKTLVGVRRFLEKFREVVEVYMAEMEGVKENEEKVFLPIINRTVKQVGEDLGVFKFNTAMAELMILVNSLRLQVKKEKGKLRKESLEKIVKLLAPFAPYLTEELWENLGGEGSVHEAGWPEMEEKYLVEKEVEIPVTIDGKVRSRIKIEMEKTGNREWVSQKVKEDDRIKEWVKGRKILKEIYVPGKIISLVLKK